MSEPLKTRHVFLDTEVFTAAKFNCESSKLAEIQKLAKEGKITLLIPQSTVDECKKRIQKMVSTAANVIKDNRNELAILKQSSLLSSAAVWNFDKKAIAAEIVSKFEAFLSNSKAVVCPLSGVSIEKLFADYHFGNPPFGEGQKKDQFPDAAAILALAKWCADKKEQAYVISEDGDLEAACKAHPETLIHQKGLGDFLHSFNTHEKALTELIESILEAKQDFIEKAIEERFKKAGFILMGQDGEVEGVSVDSVEFGKTLIIQLHDDYALVEQAAEVEYTAEVSYEDSSTGSYDSEDDTYYGRETVNEEVERTESIRIELEVQFDKEAPAEDADVTVHFSPRDFEVDVGEHPLDYK